MEVRPWGTSFELKNNSNMRLVIFDVDGTLTDSAVDTCCFLRAFVDVCGFTDVDSDWSRYKNATDVGVFCEVFESHNGRAPSSHETTKFREHLFQLFRSAAWESPFPVIPGAPEMLALLNRSSGYRVAIATGCWRESARIKMASGAMDYDAYPSASADDAPERATIIQLAVKRAAIRYGGLADSVYVGDGIWDAAACRTLRIPFIGIGIGSRAEELREAGAVHVFADLADRDEFLQVLQSIETKL
ncbi:MAG TPA: HAD family hydrolase [Candidatus Binatia bacterium]